VRWLLLITLVGILLGPSRQGFPTATTGRDVHAESDVSVVTTIPVGQAPRALVVDSSTHRVYVANAGSNTVTVIDGVGRQALATVPVGQAPCCIAVDPATHRVYVANTKGDTVSVLDGRANRPVATVPTGVGPYALAADPSSHTVYLADHGDRATIDRLRGYDPRLRLLDGASDRIVAAQPVVPESAGNGLTSVAGIAVDAPDHTVILAARRIEASWITALDSTTHQPVGTTALEAEQNLAIPTSIALDTSARLLVVAKSPGLLRLLTLGSDHRFVPQGNAQRPCRDVCALAVAVDAGTNTLYVVRRPADLQAPPPLVAPALLVEDELGTLLATVPLGRSPSAIAVDPTTHAVYITDEASNTVTMFRGVGYSPPLPSTLPPMGGGGGVGVTVEGLAAPDSPCPAD